ncbi:pentatricopeptide repeat-containing protein At4g14170 [Ananas comosus]|uniref:Pentatricopeptide repeat-containing protein At4g14170 n=1 Tax=Ananas comosus TaxID=4615 RepID=A0A6P5ESH3_ANACO|nr:pentatricopeptide repeat-containing protein At4g14170 [Ananas comosus]XP_020086455.1 pentatricopeptide repeat-containing protein At4g14170 [Ananas comosus]XP_020086456.1 pentatricopeptide repeat-containing protein At4g14170 [Ananas comosus]XP_020086457.1 pentatricopeptide repeat-containing protein At4g14170 [Ananas comosus]XP_020086458.1 pentatricopeptide repeat-containing protein At4g14170 [Ananas comosus]
MRLTRTLLLSNSPPLLPARIPHPSPFSPPSTSFSHSHPHALSLLSQLLPASSVLSLLRRIPLRASSSSFSFPWNLLIAELAKSPSPHLSLRLFLAMRSASDAPADAFTLPPVLRSCALIGSPESGMAVHALSIKMGLDRSLFVASALVSCYATLREVPFARRLFDEMPQRDAVLWTSMLSGYAQSGLPESALRFFREMVSEGVRLDGVVMVSLLLACGQSGILRHGRAVHAASIRRFSRFPLSLGNAFVDMYVKCGAFGCALKVFDRMPQKDIISWTALILGHGLNGSADDALRLFEEMSVEGVEPNSVTFLGVLSACAHAGMVEKARSLFDKMKLSGIKPELKHYSCMADALGRAGRIVEAEGFIEEMPFEPDEAILGSLLAACRVHGNVEVGERISERLMKMCPEKSGYYLSLANMYSDLGRYDDAERVREFMKQVNVGKLPGWSSVESNDFLSISQPG